ncbi:hypothetical protein, partial [Kitasatospora sp. NPDC050463]|uniref:hypothetical protein n=1 Tax=Kitasatospora sp. NPDC050463 TaxID=3155786 RepID=UPI0033FE0E20
MSSTPSFFTQAGNFASAVTGGVDPRTGLFNVQVVLGNLVGNRNLGPSLPLVLGYSPLSSANTGLGQGVTLGLTTYDTDARLLALSSGERYKTEVSPGVWTQGFHAARESLAGAWCRCSNSMG